MTAHHNKNLTAIYSPNSTLLFHLQLAFLSDLKSYQESERR